MSDEIFLLKISTLRVKGIRKNVPFLEVGGFALNLPQIRVVLLHAEERPEKIYISSVCYVIAATKKSFFENPLSFRSPLICIDLWL